MRTVTENISQELQYCQRHSTSSSTLQYQDPWAEVYSLIDPKASDDKIMEKICQLWANVMGTVTSRPSLNQLVNGEALGLLLLTACLSNFSRRLDSCDLRSLGILGRKSHITTRHLPKERAHPPLLHAAGNKSASRSQSGTPPGHNKERSKGLRSTITIPPSTSAYRSIPHR